MRMLVTVATQTSAPAVESPAPAVDPSPAPRPFADLVTDWTGNELLGRIVGNTIEPVLQIAVIVVVAWILVALARRLIDRTVAEMKDPDTQHQIGRLRRRTGLGLAEGPPRSSARRSQRADSLGALGRSVVSALIWVTAIFMILGTFGVSLGPLIASAGIVGIALGFGAQDLVKDFISGVFMLLEDQYGVGDIIDVGEAIGVVEGITLRSTRLRDLDGTLWHVPNGEIRRVGNRSQDWSRIILDVAVGYGEDVDRAGEVILAATEEFAAADDVAPFILEAPELLGVELLGDNAVAVRVACKTKAGEHYRLARLLRPHIKRALDEAGVEIPFPQRTVWIRGGDGGDAAPV